MPEVMTVLGPMSAEKLGATVPHEHALIDMTKYVEAHTAEHGPSVILNEPITFQNLKRIHLSPYSNLDNCTTNKQLALRALADFKAKGGETLVDVSLPDVGGDPTGLRELAIQSGVNIIAGTGYDMSFTFEEGFEAKTIDDITAELIRDAREGIGGTDVRAGILGELGTATPIHPGEEKVLRAAARAQAETGLAITIHVHPPAREGHNILDILESEGADLSRVVLGHLDAALAHLDLTHAEAVEYHKSLAARGAFIEYDLCGTSDFLTHGEHSWWLPSDRERVLAIRALVDAGYEDQILLSQDAAHKSWLDEYGGAGYAHVLTDFKRFLEVVGIDGKLHSKFVRDNPYRMLTGQHRVACP